MSGSVIKFEKEVGYDRVTGPDGCSYESESDGMYFGVLELCGCGCPSDVHHVLVECAKEFGKDSYGFDGVVDIVRENPEVVAQFIAHFLDSKEILEHGSNINGAWLTDLGKQFIDIGPMED